MAAHRVADPLGPPSRHQCGRNEVDRDQTGHGREAEQQSAAPLGAGGGHRAGRSRAPGGLGTPGGHAFIVTLTDRIRSPKEARRLLSVRRGAVRAWGGAADEEWWMAHWFIRHVVDTGRLRLFCFLIAFIGAFLFIRFSVRMIRAGVKWWPGNVTLGGLHIHHVVFGLVFMMIGGVGGLAVQDGALLWAALAALLFGVGAALNSPISSASRIPGPSSGP
ncbi:hypothetical protein [Streptomyces sp. SID8354]|uniref:hypothetical protein n=2 Tax=unclassified Streptomyces TaxID=2593676 RepID=UPI001926B1EB|nr:hypothetical protein [Streptomyces sp. SID8354]